MSVEIDDSIPRRESIDEPPPFLGTWPRVYLFVIIYLAALITLFGWFTHSFDA